MTFATNVLQQSYFASREKSQRFDAKTALQSLDVDRVSRRSQSCTIPRKDWKVNVASLQEGIVQSLDLDDLTLNTIMFPPEQSFTPELNPLVAVVCLIAAIPPVLYWVRFFMKRAERQREVEAKEQARLELVRKLSGRDK